MTNTFRVIQSVTVGSGNAARIEFSSIPQTFTDLMLLLSARSTASIVTGNANMTFNKSTSGYLTRNIWSNGSTVQNDNANTSFMYAGATVTGASATSSVFGNSAFYIPNYTSSENKSVFIDNTTENNATTGYAGHTVGVWTNSAAITEISLLINSGDFAQYSSATLYGISKG